MPLNYTNTFGFDSALNELNVGPVGNCAIENVSVFNGGKALVTRYPGNNPKRSEITLAGSQGHFRDYGSTWHRFVFRMIENPTDGFDSFFQIHSSPPEGYEDDWTGHPIGRNLITGVIEDNELQIRALKSPQNRYDSDSLGAWPWVDPNQASDPNFFHTEPFQLNKDYEIVIHAVPAYEGEPNENQGVIQVWINGAQVINRVDQSNADFGLYPDTDVQRGGNKNFYLKLGSYPQDSETDSHVRYYGGYRFGDEALGYTDGFDGISDSGSIDPPNPETGTTGPLTAPGVMVCSGTPFLKFSDAFTTNALDTGKWHSYEDESNRDIGFSTLDEYTQENNLAKFTTGTKNGRPSHSMLETNNLVFGHGDAYRTRFKLVNPSNVDRRDWHFAVWAHLPSGTPYREIDGIELFPKFSDGVDDTSAYFNVWSGDSLQDVVDNSLQDQGRAFNVDDNQWHEVVVQRRDDGTYFYLDDNLVHTASIPRSIFSEDLSLILSIEFRAWYNPDGSAQPDDGYVLVDYTQVWGCDDSAENLPPEFTTTSPLPTGTVSQPYTATFNAIDPEGETVTYQALNIPVGASLDSNTGVMTWPNPVAGLRSASIIASDGVMTRNVVFAFEILEDTPGDCSKTIQIDSCSMAIANAPSKISSIVSGPQNGKMANAGPHLLYEGPGSPLQANRDLNSTPVIARGRNILTTSIYSTLTSTGGGQMAIFGGYLDIDDSGNFFLSNQVEIRDGGTITVEPTGYHTAPRLSLIDNRVQWNDGAHYNKPQLYQANNALGKCKGDLTEAYLRNVTFKGGVMSQADWDHRWANGSNFYTINSNPFYASHVSYWTPYMNPFSGEIVWTGRADAYPRRPWQDREHGIKIVRQTGADSYEYVGWDTSGIVGTDFDWDGATNGETRSHKMIMHAPNWTASTAKVGFHNETTWVVVMTFRKDSGGGSNHNLVAIYTEDNGQTFKWLNDGTSIANVISDTNIKWAPGTDGSQSQIDDYDVTQDASGTVYYSISSPERIASWTPGNLSGYTSIAGGMLSGSIYPQAIDQLFLTTDDMFQTAINGVNFDLEYNQDVASVQNEDGHRNTPTTDAGSFVSTYGSNAFNLIKPVAENEIYYVPDEGFTGNDEIVVQLENGSQYKLCIQVGESTGNLAPIFTGSNVLDNGKVGDAYSYQLQAYDAEGDSLTFSQSGSALPAGLTLNSNGTITGTPTQAGSFVFTASVTDGFNSPVTREYTLNVESLTGNNPPLWVSQPTLPSGVVGTEYATSVSAEDPEQDSVTYSLVGGSLPPGLSLSQGGAGSITNALVQGTPTQAGTYTFTLAASDGQDSSNREFTLVINSEQSNLSASFRNEIINASIPVGASDTGVVTNFLDIAGAVGTPSITWSVQPSSTSSYIDTGSADPWSLDMTFTAPGVYAVNAVVTDDNGTVVATQNVVVEQEEPEINNPPTGVVNVGDYFTLVGTWIPVSGYWTDPDGDSVTHNGWRVYKNGVLITDGYQVQGADTDNPQFYIEEPGNYIFRTTITDGQASVEVSSGEVIIQQTGTNADGVRILSTTVCYIEE